VVPEVRICDRLDVTPVADRLVAIGVYAVGGRYHLLTQQEKGRVLLPLAFTEDHRSFRLYISFRELGVAEAIGLDV